MQDRKQPSPGVHDTPGGPTIVFVTVCAKDRYPWLATDTAHIVLRAIWLSANNWRVGRYVLMPDHLHFFATPGPDALDIEAWMTYWKRLVSRAYNDGAQRWQRKQWHTRMRTSKNYTEKWDYMLENPVRKGLVNDYRDWPYAGELFNIRW